MGENSYSEVVAMRNLRRKIWIDGVQTRLAVRIVLYFLFCQIVLGLGVVIAREVTRITALAFGEGQTGLEYFIQLIVPLSFAAVISYDAIKFTHRLVGPMYRFRKTIEAVTAGGEVELIRLRKGDFLIDVRDEFNEMLRELERRGAIAIKGNADPLAAATPAKEPAAVAPDAPKQHAAV
jgi:hypothetical protein